MDAWNGDAGARSRPNQPLNERLTAVSARCWVSLNRRVVGVWWRRGRAYPTRCKTLPSEAKRQLVAWRWAWVCKRCADEGGRARPSRGPRGAREFHHPFTGTVCNTVPASLAVAGSGVGGNGLRFGEQRRGANTLTQPRTRQGSGRGVPARRGRTARSRPEGKAFPTRELFSTFMFLTPSINLLTRAKTY